MFTLVFLPYILFSNNEDLLHVSTANSTKRHLTPSDLLKYFPTNQRLRSVFNLLEHRIDPLNPPKTPLAIVLAGRNLTNEESIFKEITEKNFWMDNMTIQSNEKISEGLLFNAINQKLEKSNGKVFVFIDEIDKLSGKTPLVLQTLSDVDAAKFKDAVYVLTVIDENFDKQLEDKECSDIISK